MRFAAAATFTKYDISFAPGQDNIDIQGKQRDTFTMEPGELKVIFRER